VIWDVSGSPTEEELAAALASIRAYVAETDTDTELKRSAWVRAGRLEAHGLADEYVPFETGWAV